MMAALAGCADYTSWGEQYAGTFPVTYTLEVETECGVFEQIGTLPGEPETVTVIAHAGGVDASLSGIPCSVHFVPGDNDAPVFVGASCAPDHDLRAESATLGTNGRMRIVQSPHAGGVLPPRECDRSAIVTHPRPFPEATP